jgi:hypothetical protein
LLCFFCLASYISFCFALLLRFASFHIHFTCEIYCFASKRNK